MGGALRPCDTGSDTARDTARDTGSGTVLTLGIVAVAMILALAVGSLVRAQAARSSAQTAADLAALAAAESLAVPLGARVSGSGPAGACALAAEVAGRNDARLTGCTAVGDGVVEVLAERPTVLGRARATARAGPAWARDGPRPAAPSTPGTLGEARG